MKTVREAAEELGISRQAVYSKLTDEFKEEFTTIKLINNRDTLVISKAGINELKDTIVKLDSKVDSKVDNVIDREIIELLTKNIDLLQAQLKIKDEQIAELNERLQEAQTLNKNTQILHLRDKDQKTLELESQEQKEKRTLLGKIKGLFKD